MRLAVSLQGEQQARARLEGIKNGFERVLRGALNTTATEARKTLYVQPLAVAFKGASVRKRLVIKRARSRRLNARIIPSSSGVEVIQYKRWGFDPISPTRARVWVMGPGGRKIAAGFVNPAGDKRQPLSTRSSRARSVGPGARNPQVTSYTYRRALQNAQGPSVAYWFRQLTTPKAVRWVNAFLQQELERRIRRELIRTGRA